MTATEIIRQPVKGLSRNRSGNIARIYYSDTYVLIVAKRELRNLLSSYQESIEPEEIRLAVNRAEKAVKRWNKR